MTLSLASPPSRAEALSLHQRLLDGDPVAPSDLAVAYLDSLVDWLTAHNRSVPEDLCVTAAEDAILALIKNPKAYRPERQALEVYLRIAASGDLKNLLRSEQRHRRRRASLDAVELSPMAGKYLWDVESDPARVAERQEEYEEMAAKVAAIPESVWGDLSREEAAVLKLMRLKERKTDIYAAALGILHLPIEEQRQEVKRAKDRLIKRLERAQQ